MLIFKIIIISRIKFNLIIILKARIVAITNEIINDNTNIVPIAKKIINNNIYFILIVKKIINPIVKKNNIRQIIKNDLRYKKIVVLYVKIIG